MKVFLSIVFILLSSNVSAESIKIENRTGDGISDLTISISTSSNTSKQGQVEFIKSGSNVELLIRPADVNNDYSYQLSFSYKTKKMNCLVGYGPTGRTTKVLLSLGSIVNEVDDSKERQPAKQLIVTSWIEHWSFFDRLDLPNQELIYGI